MSIIDVAVAVAIVVAFLFVGVMFCRCWRSDLCSAALTAAVAANYSAVVASASSDAATASFPVLLSCSCVKVGHALVIISFPLSSLIS